MHRSGYVLSNTEVITQRSVSEKLLLHGQTVTIFSATQIITRMHNTMVFALFQWTSTCRAALIVTLVLLALTATATDGVCTTCPASAGGADINILMEKLKNTKKSAEELLQFYKDNVSDSDQAFRNLMNSSENILPPPSADNCFHNEAITRMHSENLDFLSRANTSLHCMLYNLSASGLVSFETAARQKIQDVRESVSSAVCRLCGVLQTGDALPCAAGAAANSCPPPRDYDIDDGNIVTIRDIINATTSMCGCYESWLQGTGRIRRQSVGTIRPHRASWTRQINDINTE